MSNLVTQFYVNFEKWLVCVCVLSTVLSLVEKMLSINPFLDVPSQKVQIACA